MRAIASAIIALALLMSTDFFEVQGQEPALGRHEFQQIHMGIAFDLILYSTDEARARAASDAAFERIAGLDRALSDYDPASELNRLCDQAGGEPVPVSADLYAVLERSLVLSRATDGAFDVTVKPLVRLWRRAFRQKELPDPADLARARGLVGYENLVLDPAARTAQLKKAGIKLDVGGLAKGYASDEAQRILAAHGIDRALVAAAGDIVVSGPPPGEPGWRVGIAALDAEDRRGEKPLLLKHAAISTSGDAERFAVINGVRYSHIVDPRTGLGVVDRASASVVSSEGMTSDSLATCLFLLGPECGMALIESQPGVTALFIRRAEKGLQVVESSGWREMPRFEEDRDRPGASP